MKYTEYTAIDFVMDEYFQQWIIHKNHEAQKFWENWQQQNPEKKDAIQQAQKLVLLNQFTNPQIPSARLEEIKRKIVQDNAPVHPIQPSLQNSRPTRKLYWQRSLVAAILLLIVAASVFYFNANTKLAVVTKYGQIKEFTLPDRSKVLLNANSSLECMKNWEFAREREVWLAGEAFFEVEKKLKPVANPSNPFVKFIVHVEGLDIEVVGTQFNVNNRNGKVEVVLNEGKVRIVQENGELLEMVPGEMISYSKATGKMEIKQVDANKRTSWRNHQLFFENQPLAELAQVLEAQYGIQVVFKQTDIANNKITGVLPSDNLDVVLESLRTIYGLKIERREDQIIFY